MWVQSLGWEDPLEEAWQPTAVLLLNYPMDRGAWRATIRGVTQSQTRLKHTRIVDEQCCDSFQCIAKWIQLYIFPLRFLYNIEQSSYALQYVLFEIYVCPFLNIVCPIF